jgi:hypothetical protein
LVKLRTIAVDGTKVKASASRHKTMSYGYMLKAKAEPKAQIDALLKHAQQADEAEKNQPELDLAGEIARRELPLAAISEARNVWSSARAKPICNVGVTPMTSRAEAVNSNAHEVHR